MLNVVLEAPIPLRPAFLERVLESIADPGLFINRSYEPLYGEGAVVSPDLTVILAGARGLSERDGLMEDYASTAAIVWDMGDSLARGELPEAGSFALFSGSASREGKETDRLLQRLESLWGDRPTEILFRDPQLQAAWNERTLKINPAYRLSESILLTL